MKYAVVVVVLIIILVEKLVRNKLLKGWCVPVNRLYTPERTEKRYYW